jgi:hypothetical protein
MSLLRLNLLLLCISRLLDSSESVMTAEMGEEERESLERESAQDVETGGGNSMSPSSVDSKAL